MYSKIYNSYFARISSFRVQFGHQVPLVGADRGIHLRPVRIQQLSPQPSPFAKAISSYQAGPYRTAAPPPPLPAETGHSHPAELFVWHPCWRRCRLRWRGRGGGREGQHRSPSLEMTAFRWWQMSQPVVNNCAQLMCHQWGRSRLELKFVCQPADASGVVRENRSCFS